MKGFSPFNKGAKYTSAYKKASYADAKKNDPDLDAKIKAVRSGDLNRNEQAKMQNKINKAYGVDKRHETNDPIKGPKQIKLDTKKEPGISKINVNTQPKPAPEKTKYEKKADKIIARGEKKEEKKENRQKNREERKDKRDKNQKRRQDLRNTKKKINKEAKDSKKMAKFLSKNPDALDAAKNV